MSTFTVLANKFRGVSTEMIKEFLRLADESFEVVLKKVNIIACEKGNCLAEMKVDKDHLNAFNTMHGGFSATLVDCISSYALLTHEKRLLVPSVSVDMHMSYLKEAKIGDEIVIDAKTQKAGNSIGYLTCEIRNKGTGDLLVKGSHTKYFINLKD